MLSSETIKVTGLRAQRISEFRFSTNDSGVYMTTKSCCCPHVDKKETEVEEVQCSQLGRYGHCGLRACNGPL